MRLTARAIPTTLFTACLIAAALLTSMSVPTQAALPTETKEQIDQRMAWWRSGKFGMFIHWGLYAVPAGEWKGKPVNGLGEWIMSEAKIPVSEYEPLVKQFNPVKYDAKRRVEVAKAAGMKYIVITSKHHDGFCLFDSAATDYDIASTPFVKDLLAPLAAECHKQGLKICWYHSIMDWHHPQAKAADWPKYREHLKTQLKELLTKYGDIGVLWFDGEWIGEWDAQQGKELEAYLREIQPSLIVNNRVGKRQRTDGDFGTPEQEIPATGIPGYDWETCMTMNDTWGFKKNDANWKTPTVLIQNLVDIVSKGGNFLLNVGPTAEGEIPVPSVERLEAVGRWMQVNGESIYGTSASPFAKLEWGRATQKPGKLYLHVFQWPGQTLVVQGLKNKVKKAYLLADVQQTALKHETLDTRLAISLPSAAPDPIDSVVVLEIEGPVEIAAKPAIAPAADGSITLLAADAEVHGLTMRYEPQPHKNCLGYWSNPADWASWTIEPTKPGKYELHALIACDKGSGGSQVAFNVGETTLPHTMKETGSWATFVDEKLGVVDVVAPGKLTVSVKPKSKPGVAVMDLKQLVLKPVK